MQKANWWIFILLISFLLLLVPKNTWHDCDQQHFSKKTSGNEYKIEKEHCNICDFQFYPAIVQETIVFFCSKIKFQKKQAKDYQITFTSPILLSLRGPPFNLFESL